MRQVIMASCVSLLLLGACGGPDVPPPTFSQSTQIAYDEYLSAKKGDPGVFIVSEDGEISYRTYCPLMADFCTDVGAGGGTISDGIKWCEEKADTPCHVYARGRRVVWN